MKPVVDGKNAKVTTEGRKHLEKLEVKTRDSDTVEYVERKLFDKGVARMDRHPADGLPLKYDPKKGHGGKYTWEGPEKEVEPAPPAIDEKDPNYVEEETTEVEDEEVKELVVGEVEVAKAAEAEEGVARIEVDPHLKVN